jgi:hypothetical protein
VNLSGVPSTSEPAALHTTGESPRENTASPEDAALPWEELLLDESTLANSRVLPYALMVASVIERRTISRDELITALRKRMRQRSMGVQPRREYVLRYLNQHPP